VTSRLIPVYQAPREEGPVVDGGPSGPVEMVVDSFRGARRLQSFRATVTGSPALVLPENPGRRTVTVKNEGANDVFIGGEDVTTDNGYRLAAGDALTLELSGALYAVTAGTVETLYGLAEVDER